MTVVVIQTRPNIYVGHINGKLIKLIYRGNDKADLYIDGKFKGIAPFTYTKNKVEELERTKRSIDLYV
jgi:hypothetical protein